jgi:predicted metal-dependent hydrolase
VLSPRAKYLRLQVSSLKGLELIVPRGVNHAAVMNFIKDHQDWISKKIIKQEEETYYLGTKLHINTKSIPLSRYYEFSFNKDTLTIEGDFSNKPDLHNLYENWLFLHARKVLVKRTHQLAAANGFKVNKAGVRRQTSRWGSCSGKGNISLNYKLLKYPQEIIDYVIFHELCHLIEMNHSEKFWKLVGKYVPDYKLLRKKLKSP